MGRKRKDFSDKFKIEVAKEALKKRAKEAEVAAKYNIAPSTLSEWMELFLEGKLETDEQKALREENEKLRAKQEEMLASLGKKQLEVDLLKKKLHLDEHPGTLFKKICAMKMAQDFRFLNSAGY